MELYFLDHEFKAISPPMDTAISVVWSLQLSSCGTFSVELPLTTDAATSYDANELLTLATKAAYLCDRTYCGRIETVICRSHRLHLGGRLLECLLYDRVAAAEEVFTGTIGSVARAVVSKWMPTWEIPETMPVVTDTAQSYTISAGVSIGSWLHGLLSPHGAGYTVTMVDGTLHFSLFMGTDRSLDGAAGVGRAIFSEEYGNMAKLETERYREGCIDRVYVAGQDGTVVTVTRAGDSPWQRECYIHAADIRANAYTTVAQYKAALHDRGRELLAERNERYRLTCMGEDGTLPRYGTDYMLGDICEVQGDTLGVRCALQLTAVDIVYEGGIRRLYPYFGGVIDRIRTRLG